MLMRILALLVWFDGGVLAAQTQDLQVGASHFADDARRINSLGMGSSFTSAPKRMGFETTINLSGGFKSIEFVEISELLKEQIGDTDRAEEKSIGLGIMQGLGVGTTLGPVVDASDGTLSSQLGLGALVQQWWNKETIRTSLSYKRSTITTAPISYVDTDGKKVATKEKVIQQAVGGSVSMLLTPRTIAGLDLRLTMRDDRPPTKGADLEWRQSFGSVVLLSGFSYGESLGEILAVTTIGELVGYSGRLEARAQLARSWRFDLGYRAAVEQETPRAEDAPLIERGTDSLHAALHYALPRKWFPAGLVLHPFSNLSRTNLGILARTYGLGLVVGRQ